MTAVRTGVAAAARCLALDQLGAHVITALHQAGIDVVLLKGAGLAQRLYPDNPDARRYSDVDLLVAPATFELTERVLAEMGLIDRSSGLREDEMAWYEHSWGTPGPASLTVDLHRSFHGVRDPVAFWEIVSTSTETLDLCGTTVHVPDAVSCALVVGLHAAVPGPGLGKPLADLAEALALLPDSVWDQAAQLARRTKSADAFARGMSLHSDGKTMVERLQLKAEGTLADDLIARQAGWAPVHLAKLLALRDPRAKLRFVALRLFTSPARMRLRHTIARRGRIGLAAAYVFQTLQVAAHAPRAILLVRNARRSLKPQPHPRDRRLLRTLRVLVDLDGPDRLTCVWTLRTLHQARRQLAVAPLADLDLTVPPSAGRSGSRTVDRVLAHQRANCLEAALVRQRWLAGQGIAYDILIGVTGPGEGFRAHAWLDDPDAVKDSALTEIHRRPPPPAWLTMSRPSSRLRVTARD